MGWSTQPFINTACVLQGPIHAALYLFGFHKLQPIGLRRWQ